MSDPKNRETRQAIEYHLETKHTLRKLRQESHRLDWSNKPDPFKEYRNQPSFVLPEPGNVSKKRAHECIGGRIMGPVQDINPNFLSRLCHYAAGVTRVRESPSGEKHYFRAAACAGALYPTELYLQINRTVDDRLPPGLYHFHPRRRALFRLRKGRWNDYLAAITGEPSVVGSEVQFLFSTIPWRSSWKYRARAYRHLFWDSGTILANLHALARSGGYDPLLVDGFIDEALNEFLGVDGTREWGIAMVVLREDQPPETTRDALRKKVPKLDVEAATLSENPKRYELIRQAHEHSKLTSLTEVAQWGETVPPQDEPEDFKSVEKGSLIDGRINVDSLETVIQRRGSSRQFRQDSIDLEELDFLLRTAWNGPTVDFSHSEGFQLIDVYVTANAVDGLKPGGYYWDPTGSSIKITTASRKETRKTAGQLCLGQKLATDAACVLFTLTPLRAVVEQLGNRGYRAAQHEGGIFLGKINLLTYAQKLASTGITFFDDKVSEYFLPHSEGKTPMTSMCVGKEGNREGLR